MHCSSLAQRAVLVHLRQHSTQPGRCRVLETRQLARHSVSKVACMAVADSRADNNASFDLEQVRHILRAAEFVVKRH